MPSPSQMTTLFHDVRLVYLAVALAQGAVVAVACIGPALRASRVDPLVALRTD